jgi:Protein of unknown function (DUF2796)
MNPSQRITATLIDLALSTSAAWAGKAHEHGVMKLDVVLEGSTLSVNLQSPLDSFLGFERAPRTDAERKAAADLLARLRGPNQGQPLFAADAAAQCTMSKAEVRAPVLATSAVAAAQDGHADLDAEYTFTCARPAELKVLDLGLFEAFRRLQRIDVQVAGPQGQSRVTLKRPARSIKLAR